MELNAHKLQRLYKATEGLELVARVQIEIPYRTDRDKDRADSLLMRLNVEGFMVAQDLLTETLRIIVLD